MFIKRKKRKEEDIKFRAPEIRLKSPYDDPEPYTRYPKGGDSKGIVTYRNKEGGDQSNDESWEE